jgi:hypothetical protein
MEAARLLHRRGSGNFCQDTPLRFGGAGGVDPRYEAYCMAIIGHVGSEGAMTKLNTIFSTISSYLN